MVRKLSELQDQDHSSVLQMLHMVHQFKGDVATVSGGVISVSTPVKEAVVIYPEHKTLPITQNGCEWLIQLPDFTIQQFIILKK